MALPSTLPTKIFGRTLRKNMVQLININRNTVVSDEEEKDDSPSDVINQLGLKQKIFPRQKKVADVVLRTANGDSVTDAK